MAIVNHPPWEAYATGTDWAYKIEGIWQWMRPNCKVISLKTVVRHYLKSKEK